MVRSSLKLSILLILVTLSLTGCKKKGFIVNPLFTYAQRCNDHGEYEKAQKAYGFCTVLAPRFIEAYAYRAVALVHLRRYDQALNCLKQGYGLDSTHAVVLNCYGIFYNHKGIKGKARQYFKKAVRYASNAYNPYANLALMAMEEEKYDSALFYISHGINESPEFHAGFLIRGSVYEATKQNDKAINDYSKALSRCRGVNAKLSVLTYRGNLFRRMGRFDDALQDYNNMLKIQHPPNAKWTHYYMGMAYVGKKNYKKALIEFRMARTLGKKGINKVIEEVRRMMPPVE